MANNDIDELAYIAIHEFGSPVDYGWHLDNGSLVPTFFEGPTAADPVDGLSLPDLSHPWMPFVVPHMYIFSSSCLDHHKLFATSPRTVCT